jgi:ferrochelatase
MYDAVLIVSFGGPEKREDVMPFLANVTRGRNVPQERLNEVAEHYYHFGGRSPINDQCRELITALREELSAYDIRLPIYWGNRNWHPFLSDALRKMRDDGIRRALAFATSAYSSYSGCRQYRENIAAAQAEVGEGVPRVDKLRVFYNHPGFIEACADGIDEARAHFSRLEQTDLRLVTTAHSIPSSMAQTSAYEKQLAEAARLVAESTGFKNWDLVYQSRSGPPTQPWLGPDILDHLRSLYEDGVKNVVLSPIGFTSDHLEVLYDLDVEARQLTDALGMKMARAATAGTHPAFVRAIRELIEERISLFGPKASIGQFGPNHDYCPDDCCPAPQRADKPLVLVAPGVSQRP